MRFTERVLLTLVLLAAVAAVFWFAVPVLGEAVVDPVLDRLADLP